VGGKKRRRQIKGTKTEERELGADYNLPRVVGGERKIQWREKERKGGAYEGKGRIGRGGKNLHNLGRKKRQIVALAHQTKHHGRG